MTNENLLLQESVVVSEKLALAYKDVAEKKDTKLAEQEIFQTEVHTITSWTNYILQLPGQAIVY